jgi:hypothetical protein
MAPKANQAAAAAIKAGRGRSSATKEPADLSGDSAGSGDHKHRRTYDDRSEDDDIAMDTAVPPATSAIDARFDALSALITAKFARDDLKEEKFLGILDTLGSRFDSFEAKFSAADLRAAKVDEQLDLLQARFAAFEQRESTSPAGPAASGAPSASSGGTHPSSRSSPAAAVAETLVFFDRAQYDLHRLVLGRYWNDKVKPLVSRAAWAGTTPHIGHRDTFAIAFPSELAAKAFLTELDAKGGAPELVDNEGTVHILEARLQRNKVPTKFGKQLSPVFQHYLNLLQTRAAFKKKEFTLHADAHRGRIYIEKDEHLIMLHTLNRDGVSLRSYEERLDEFGLVYSDCQAAAKLFVA